jgi:hypothetical protein
MVVVERIFVFIALEKGQAAAKKEGTSIKTPCGTTPATASNFNPPLHI